MGNLYVNDVMNSGHLTDCHIITSKKGIKYRVIYLKKDYKNLKKDKNYLVKKIGSRQNDSQLFYLIKGRWVHSNYCRNLSTAEIRKFKISKLLDEDTNI